jgi:hypothetical protein
MGYDAEGKPYEPVWPEAEFIVGNPPFVGGNKIRKELGSSYVEPLFELYKDRLSGFSDLVCYWFEIAAAVVSRRPTVRVGLLATQAIRGGVNRAVLTKIGNSGQIFMAWSDRDWVLDGATVHTSFIAFDGGQEKVITLDAIPVKKINPDLTSGPDTTTAKQLPENRGIWAYGSQTKGSFDISTEKANQLLSSLDPFNKGFDKVVLRSMNGSQLLDDRENRWIIDFGEDMPLAEAMLYEAPFEHINVVVRQGERSVNHILSRNGGRAML